MTTILPMPELIENEIIKLVSRNNHRLDEEIWHQTNKNRAFLRRYLDWVDNTNSVKDCRSTTDMFTGEWTAGKIYCYSILLKSSGEVIGSIDIHACNNKHQNAEIGYWLAEAYNGRGLMSMAVQLIEKQAFLCGYHRLFIAVQKENLPSARVAERNNYIYEGTLKDAILLYGEFHDELIFAKINKS